MVTHRIQMSSLGSKLVTQDEKNNKEKNTIMIDSYRICSLSDM